MTLREDLVLAVPPEHFRFFDVGGVIVQKFHKDCGLKKGDNVVWQFHQFDGHARVIHCLLMGNDLVCTFKKAT